MQKTGQLESLEVDTYQMEYQTMLHSDVVQQTQKLNIQNFHIIGQPKLDHELMKYVIPKDNSYFLTEKLFGT